MLGVHIEGEEENECVCALNALESDCLDIVNTTPLCVSLCIKNVTKNVSHSIPLIYDPGFSGLTLLRNSTMM